MSELAWHWPPHMEYECRTCHTTHTCKPDKDPPEECKHCGNRGQSLLHCRDCDRYIPAKRFDAIMKAEGWECWEGDDRCPVCIGYEIPENEIFTIHEYSGKDGGRCDVCGEAQRHGIHETWLLEDEDE